MFPCVRACVCACVRARVRVDFSSCDSFLLDLFIFYPYRWKSYIVAQFEQVLCMQDLGKSHSI